MSATTTAWTEDRVDRFIGNLLRAGVVLAAGVIFVGGVLYLIRHGGEVADHKIFQGEPPSLTTPLGILESAAALDSMSTAPCAFFRGTTPHFRSSAPAGHPSYGCSTR